ncbi:hypothetical protein [Aggregatibacter actinomycetemcomitans]|uniref:hypothetical protein n=1 Tax=Aggregatibacter actinomycetemcomitans TaxID=714 RepID=UPI0006BCDCB5|nr:hypothetical protein [Aggregatibacter actinomycetemcomitans]QEH47870.1 hypothetical protein FXN59_10145 [Aggregatibacter actinomycetemcomitans]TYA50131.1 hypothetical protein FXB74_00190 [Aggregatibacter actinomycetemcomitans]TYA50996.1 hypothetical protein FXB81_06265 [Aggregatibacter actinomycetemcomitans]BAS48572.1 hypothetical protein AANUM_1341 [Aggregatibacter actinomycetemcomitans NUM4039]
MLESCSDFLATLRELASEEDILNFTRKYVIHGTPYIFKDKENEYYDFRKRISEKWNVSFHEVFITGSAKLGYSYYKDKNFDEDSDIDVAIVSSELFNEIMLTIEDFQWKIRRKSIYLDMTQLEKYHIFLKYLAIGWIRPDKLPNELLRNDKLLKEEWFDFFKSISNGKSEVGNYKVAAGVFKSYKHFENYIYYGISDKYKTIKYIDIK